MQKNNLFLVIALSLLTSVENKTVAGPLCSKPQRTEEEKHRMAIARIINQSHYATDEVIIMNCRLLLLKDLLKTSQATERPQTETEEAIIKNMRAKIENANKAELLTMIYSL